MMLKRLNKKFPISEIIDQVSKLDFDKRLAVNETTGDLFSGVYTIKTEFKNTPLGNVLEEMGDIGEARLLKLVGGETYTAHTDPDDRFHLAITTNPHCYLLDLDNEKMFQIPVDGHMWTMDTSFKHIAANFGGSPRIHLNIRHRLPEFKSPGYRVKFDGVDNFDWKQQLHIDVLGFINCEIKKGNISGIAKVSEREMLINCSQSVIDYIVSINESKGFKAIITEE